MANFLRETADCWNAQIEDWTYVKNTELAKQVGVDGYYLRIAPPDLLEHNGPADCVVEIKNHPNGTKAFPASEIVSVDALALVRFGLRAADDPRITNTIKVIDAKLKTETATGPVWHRYTHDGYGETEDGGPFLHAGIGRGWPLLGGERAHYEIAAGNMEKARFLLGVMGTQTSPGGMLPEQVWDAEDIPKHELFNGHPSGSGMPLVWAHSEYLKLIRSLDDGQVFDMPPQPLERYIKNKTGSKLVIWRFDHQIHQVSSAKTLRIETQTPAQLRWSSDEWETFSEETSFDTGFGIHTIDLPPFKLPPNSTLRFTFYWPQAQRWEGKDFEIRVMTQLS
jgi:glucoamylase